MSTMRDETAPRQLSASAARDDMQRLHALCGTRLYCVSTLAGLFPDLGWHQPGEMGGIWAPPIKLLDGFWLGLRGAEGAADGADEVIWLAEPESWRMAEDGVTRGYHLPALGVQVTRREWIVPGESVLVVEVTIATDSSPDLPQAPQTALACGLVARSDLHGAWLSEERLGWTDGEDRAAYREDLGAVDFVDMMHPEWSVCVGATARPATYILGDAVWGPERTGGRGTGAALWYRCELGQGQPATLRFLIAGSFQPEEPATAIFARYVLPEREAEGARREADTVDPAAVGHRQTPLRRAHETAIARFRAPFERCVLRSPDAHLDEVFAWTQATADWLHVEVPGLSSGLMAGLPDFAWWFGCDTAYGVPPMLPAGQGHAAAAALRTLAEVSRRHNGDGAVVHEVVTNGAVYASGNLVEVPLFARALYHTYRWTGDRALLADLFPFCVQGVLEYALGARLEGEECVPQGRSIVETPEMHGGLQTLDVGAYLVEALDLLAALARDLEQPELAATLQRRAARMRRHLRADWWLAAEGLFGDVRASRPELRALLNRLEARQPRDDSVAASIERLRCALADGTDEGDGLLAERRPWLLRHHVQALAADAGLPEAQQAAALLGRLERDEWTETYGLVLNAATDRHVMSLPTGALAVGEARYGRADAALATIQRLAACFGADSPGTLSEYSPRGGCFLQLWSNYGLIWPVVHYFFGLRPDVAARRLVCAPQLPSNWPWAELRAVTLGECTASVAVSAIADGVRVVVELDDPTWEVTLGAVVPADARSARAVAGETVVPLRAAELAEPEGRCAWLAPARRGAGRYELSVSWSGGGAPETAAAAVGQRGAGQALGPIPTDA
jgi:hypothetical protein